MKKLQEIKEQYDAIKQKMQDDGKAALGEAFKEFFAANPNVQEICWRQYTPYFNDGETCEFSVHEFVFHTKTKDDLADDESEEEDDWFYSWSKSTTQVDNVNTKMFERLLNGLPDDLFKDVFGDHSEIRATTDGFDVEEYEHE